MEDRVASSRPTVGAAAVGLAFAVVLATHWLHGGMLERAGLVSSAMSDAMLVLAPVVLAVLAVVALSGVGRISWPGTQVSPSNSGDTRSAAWDVAFIALVASFVLDSLYLLDGAVLHTAPLVLALAGAAVVQACGAAAAYLACRQIHVALHRLANPPGVVLADRTGAAPDENSRALFTLWSGVTAGSRAPPSITSLA